MKKLILYLSCTLICYCIIACNSTTLIEDAQALAEKKCLLNNANRDLQIAQLNITDKDKIDLMSSYVSSLNEDVDKTITKYNKKYDEKG
ncbi:MAG: hypothetical protein WCG87_13395, partial [Bacteroidota bacterium]